MNNEELTKRYLYAATKNLPSDMQQEVARELEGLIADMLEERCNGQEPTPEQLHAVLTKLGPPSVLAEEYLPRREALIPQPYYRHYKAILPVVLAAAGGGVSIAVLLRLVLNTPAPTVPEVIAQLSSGIHSALLQGFAGVTIIFAVLARHGSDLLQQEDFLNDLPPVPISKKSIRRSGSIVGIALNIVFMLVMLLIPEAICAMFSRVQPQPVPLFDSVVIRSFWPAILIIGLAGVCYHCIALVEGAYTHRLMWASLVCNAVMAVASIVLLGHPGIINPAYRALIAQTTDLGAPATYMLSNIHMLALLGMLLGFAMDCYKHIRACRRSA